MLTACAEYTCWDGAIVANETQCSDRPQIGAEDVKISLLRWESSKQCQTTLPDEKSGIEVYVKLTPIDIAHNYSYSCNLIQNGIQQNQSYFVKTLGDTDRIFIGQYSVKEDQEIEFCCHIESDTRSIKITKDVCDKKILNKIC